MSRAESPSPRYDRPGFDMEENASFRPVPCMPVPCILVPVLVPVAPLWPRLSPREVGAFVSYKAAPLTRRQFEEVQAFLGWALELLILPPDSTHQLRNQLRIWQRELQSSTFGCRLTWTEAFALHGLQF